MKNSNKGLILVGGLTLVGVAYFAFNTNKDAVKKLTWGIGNVSMGAIHFLTSTLHFKVRASNPSTSPVEFKDVQIDCDLIHNGNVISSLNQKVNLQVPASGSQILQVDSTMDNIGVVSDIISLVQGNAPVTVTIKGTIKYAGITVPVNLVKNLTL